VRSTSRHRCDAGHSRLFRPAAGWPAAALAVLLVAACGSGKPSLEITQAPSSVTVTTTTIGTLGQILTSGGHPLYVFPPDHRAAVLCDSACQGTWPPLTVTSGGRVAAGSGADSAKLGTIARPGASDRVVTYDGWPLYRYAGDVDPGTANGQGLTLNGGPWYVMRPSGQPVVLNEQGQP
jgi:predicted lipoprotein with Yx(FWY)xxD motif